MSNKVKSYTYVLCNVGSQGFIEKGKKYTVLTETENGYVLFEVSPPRPYTSFHKNRFEVLNETNDELRDLFNGIREEKQNNTEYEQ